MDAQVLHAAFEQQRADGVGHAADADLQAGAILDLGAICRATVRSISVGSVGQLRGRLLVALDDVVDLADVHAVLRAVDVGQLAGSLDDHDLGAFDRPPDARDRSAQS